MAFTYHPDLVFRGAVLYERTKRIPTLQEVMDIDPTWESDIYTLLDYWDWIREGGASKLLGALNRYKA